jgi:hypothetical protein
MLKESTHAVFCLPETKINIIQKIPILQKTNYIIMKSKRSSGILLHITSLPGKYGIGTLGKKPIILLIFWWNLVRSSGKFYLWDIQGMEIHHTNVIRHLQEIHC